MVRLQHNGSDVLLRPVDDGWCVEYRGREAVSAYLEFAIAKAIGVDASEAIPLATQLLDAYLSSAPPPKPRAR